MPEIEGKGELEYRGKAVKAAMDNRLSYYNTKGELLWEEDNSYNLLGEGIVKEEKNIPDMLTTIYYPKLENIGDERVEKGINEKLYKGPSLAHHKAQEYQSFPAPFLMINNF